MSVFFSLRNQILLSVFLLILFGKGCSQENDPSDEATLKYTTNPWPTVNPNNGPLNEQNSLIRIKEAGAFLYVNLLDSDNAKEFFQAMVQEVLIENDAEKKFFVTQQNPLKQKLVFSCWHQLNQNKYGCDIAMDRALNGKVAYRSHLAKNDNNIYIIRNDTDYSAAGKVIHDLFPSLETVNSQAGLDPQIGYSVSAGEEFHLPSGEATMMLSCRSGGGKYFCKFVVKRPN